MIVSFLGKELGNATGWDGDPGECVWFYEFTPTPTCEIPACKCLQIDEYNGMIHAQDDEGGTLSSWKIVHSLERINP